MPNRKKLAIFLMICCVFAVGSLFWKPNSPIVKPPRNIYLITVSGLNPAHLSCYLYAHIQTPGIDFLAYDGVRFTSAFTTSPQPMLAHFSILTGLYPFRPAIEKTMANIKPESVAMLPQWFHGYRSAAFLADNASGPPDFYANHFQEVKATQSVRTDATDWVIKYQQDPQFLFLNFNQPTEAFKAPEPYSRQYANHPYDGKIASLDEDIERFIHFLKDRNLFQNAVVVFTAPYGGHGENDGALDDELLSVPLLIVAPGILPRHVEYHAQASIVDVVPTILSLLEISSPFHFDGTPLFQKGTDQEITRPYIYGLTFVPETRFFARSAKSKLIIGTKEEFSGDLAEKQKLRLALSAERSIERPGRSK